MSTKNQLPLSIRNLRARLRPLQQPIVWGSVVFLGLLTLFSWELWSSSGEFSAEEFSPEESNLEELTEEFNSELSSEEAAEDNPSESVEAIAADIDSSSVLEEDLKRLETPPPLPNTDFQALQPKQADPLDLSTLTTPAAILPNDPANENSEGFSNIFLSGRTPQLQINNLVGDDLSGNPTNDINGSGINVWTGNGGMNSSAIAPDGNPEIAISPLQEAIIRRSVATNLLNPSDSLSNPQTATTPQPNLNPLGSSLTSGGSEAIGSNGVPGASTEGNNLSPNSQTNPFNIITKTTKTTPNATQPTNSGQRQQVTRNAELFTPSSPNSGQRQEVTGNPELFTPSSPNSGLRQEVTGNPELFTPVSPASTRTVNSSQRGYNPYNQSPPSNSRSANNSYQYLLQSGSANPTAGAANPGQFVNPRTTQSLTTPIAPGSAIPPSLQIPNRSNIGTINPENLEAISQPLLPTATQPSLPTATQPLLPTATQPLLPTATQPSLPTATQPSLPTATQPSLPIAPSLRSVELPQGVQTTVPNANGLTGGGLNSPLNSNLSSSQGQTLQPPPAFSVPRPIPGRHIGGGQINTFSNP